MISDELYNRVKNKDKKTKLKTTVRDDVEERTVKRNVLGEKKALQIKWDKITGGIVHLHCKTCGNSWGRISGLNPNTKFEIQKISPDMIIACRRCGSRWRSGGGNL